MKKVVFMLLVSVAVACLTACDKVDEVGVGWDSESRGYIAPKTTSSQPENPTSDDTRNWGTAAKRNLSPVGEALSNAQQWEGRMVFFCDGDSLVKTANQPVAFFFENNDTISQATTNEDASYTSSYSVASSSQNTTYGEWEGNDKEGYIRQVVMENEVKTTEFSKKVVLVRHDAKCVVNGIEHMFLNHSLSLSFSSLDILETKSVERNDSVFEQKVYSLTLNAKFGVSTFNEKVYSISTVHTVERFISLKNENDGKDDDF